jgi:histidine triad (HIT) family protein
MSDCVFCKIVSGEISAACEYEDEEILAFRDSNPSAPVHVLIIPKKHIDSLNSVTVENQNLLGKIQLVAKSLADTLGVANGYKLELNAGRYQEVMHMHYHLKGGMN